MARRGFKHRLKVTRESIEKFCNDLKIVKMLTSPDRSGSSGAESVSLLSEEEDPKSRPFMEKLDLSRLGPSDVFQDEGVGSSGDAVNSNTTPLKWNFDLPRSPRIEAVSADRNVEMRRLRRKSIESPRTFLNGLAGIESLLKKDGNLNPLLVSFIFTPLDSSIKEKTKK